MTGLRYMRTSPIVSCSALVCVSAAELRLEDQRSQRRGACCDKGTQQTMYSMHLPFFKSILRAGKVTVVA